MNARIAMLPMTMRDRFEQAKVRHPQLAQFADGLRGERGLLLSFSALALLLFLALIVLVNSQVERGRSLRLEQAQQHEALSACRQLAGSARQDCTLRAELASTPAAARKSGSSLVVAAH